MQDLIDLIVSNTAICDDSDYEAINLDIVSVCVTGTVNPDVLSSLVLGNQQGAFCAIDFSDRKEHSFIEVGGWIGDQGLALRLMALGKTLGIFNLLTPSMVMPGIGQELAIGMARSGYVTARYIDGH